MGDKQSRRLLDQIFYKKESEILVSITRTTICHIRKICRPALNSLSILNKMAKPNYTFSLARFLIRFLDPITVV
jgi:hypothetical protein